VNSLHGLLSCEIGGLYCRVSTTEYRTRVHCIPMYHLLCNALVYGMYSGVYGQCSHTMVYVSCVFPILSLTLLPKRVLLNVLTASKCYRYW